MEADVTGPLTTSAQDWEKGGGDFGGSFLLAGPDTAGRAARVMGIR